ncbi:10 kDa chaperonin-like, partial [Vicia villosa]|uniref:10 kDa chaperonin-like n=1 Tax=Vicia villosa TaxID=3911 RepID=UPI00273B6914
SLQSSNTHLPSLFLQTTTTFIRHIHASSFYIFHLIDFDSVVEHFLVSKQLISGKVIAVGPGSRDRSGNLISVSVKEDDHVLLPEYGGSQIKLDDKEFHLFRDEDILGILHD